MMHTRRIAGRLLWRELRSGELNLLVIALLIAVASMTSVGFITQRVADAMQHQSGELIAADLLVKSSTPADPAWRDEAMRLGITVANITSFASVVLAGDSSSLSSIKAVDASYPLRGTMLTSAQAYTDGEPTSDIPAPGEAWLDSRLLNALGIEVGDQVELGNTSLKINRILISEPDFSGNIFNTAPRLLFNIADVDQTGLVIPGSRVEYRQLYAGSADAIAILNTYLKNNLREGDSLLGVRDARPELNVALERAERFLGLTALIAVLISAVAIAISAQRFARRHRPTSARMRTFGARQADILNLYVIQLAMLGSVACLAGVALGYLGHLVMAGLFSQLIITELPPIKLLAAGPGFATGMLLIFSFALPPLYQLRSVPPGQVLRTDTPMQRGLSLKHYLPAAVIAPLLILWQAGDVKLALLFMVGLTATVVILAIIALLLLLLIDKLKSHANVTLRIGLTYLTRRRFNTLTESVGFGVGMMAIILLVLVRADLLNDWTQTLPEGTPNQFVINVQPDQIDAIADYFDRAGMPQPSFYPMVRGRLKSVNGEAVIADNYDDPQTQRLATRVFNLSWADEVQRGNEIVEGQWWDGDTQKTNQISFDEGLARRMNLALGDELVFASAGEEVSATITSIRKINWGTFQPNFYAILPPAALADFPATYISSFYIAAQDKAFLNQLIREFRNLTVIDVGQMINQVRGIMDQVTLVIEFVFLFTIMAGLLVMFATMQSTHDERMRDNAIMKTFGASRRQLRSILMVEFVFIGLMSSIIASFAANLTGFSISHFLMKIPYQLHMSSLLLSILVGTTLITIVGLLAFRQYHRQSANEVLRRV